MLTCFFFQKGHIKGQGKLVGFEGVGGGGGVGRLYQPMAYSDQPNRHDDIYLFFSAISSTFPCLSSFPSEAELCSENPCIGHKL
jgi:hypothetical protein